MITKANPQTWKELQTKVAEILAQCNFDVVVEKPVSTVRESVELDVYAVESINNRKYSIACECKYWNKRVPKTVVHAFRTVVIDLGCNVGYIVSKSKFQSGSFEAAAYSNIELLTWEEFQNKFFRSWYYAYFSPEVTEKLDLIMTYTEPLKPKWVRLCNDADEILFNQLYEQYFGFGCMLMSFTTYAQSLRPDEIPNLPYINYLSAEQQQSSNIPATILEEDGYVEFLQKCMVHAAVGVAKFKEIKKRYVAEDDYD